MVFFYLNIILLELAEEARELLPELDIIILTGFDDFKYTQKAIQQCINDYLLKTSKPDDIIRTILRAKQRIEERNHQTKRAQSQLKRTLFEKYIIYGETSEQTTADEFNLSLNWVHNSFAIEGYQIWILVGTGWSDTSKTETLLSFSIENICNELLPCETFIYQSKVIAVLPVYDSKNEFEFRKNYLSLQKNESMLRCQIGVTVG